MNAQSKRVTIVRITTATVFSGAAFYFGTGLHPQWWLLWIAPVPVLLLSPQMPWVPALVAALAARLLGACCTITYFRILLVKVPVGTRLAYLLIPVFVFTLAVMLFRAFCRRGQLWLAFLAFPSLIVAYEYCNSFWAGTFWDSAYTQLDNLPVLQLAAITGPWGVSFVVLMFSSGVALILLDRRATARRLSAVLVGAMLCVTGYGAYRLLDTPYAPHSVRMGLISTGNPASIQPFSEPADIQLRLLRDYSAEARKVAARGAQIVVLPEMMTLVYGSYSRQADQIFEETAHQANAHVLIDVLSSVSGETYNEARLYSPAGTLETFYRKQHPAYVLGENVTPAKDIAVSAQPEGMLGLAICSDLDYSEPARRYGRSNVGLLLVPAWDSYLSESWHGHMAIMRGVENGYSIVRSSKVGLLTVSDDRGRILAETSAAPNTPFTTMLATVPVRHDQTLYDVLGDWFGQLNLVLLCGLLISYLAQRKTPRLRAAQL